MKTGLLPLVCLAAACGSVPDPDPNLDDAALSKEETPEGWGDLEYPVPQLLTGTWQHGQRALVWVFYRDGTFLVSSADRQVQGAYRIEPARKRMVLHLQVEEGKSLSPTAFVVFYFSSGGGTLHLLRAANSLTHEVFPREREVWLHRERTEQRALRE